MALPQDLVSDILVRLPVKSLMRFKCVERSWNALFRTPTFVNRHGTHMRSKSEERIIIFNQKDEIRDLNCRNTMLSGNEESQVQDVECPFAEPTMINIFSYGPCNGVFCLYQQYRDGSFLCVLWNPATREVKVVPPPPHMPSHDHYLRGYHYKSTWAHDVFRGFGAAGPNANEFKVINVVIDRKNRLHPPSVELYNLSTDSWTVIRNDTIPDNSNDLSPEILAVLANGVCHWLTRIGAIGDPPDILCFDFRNNQFRTLKPPPTVIAGLLAEVDDSIAYIVNYSVDDYHGRAEIWILEQDSWTKKYNIGPLVAFRGYYMSIHVVWKDGAEFLGFPTEGEWVVSYNSDAQPVRRFQLTISSCRHPIFAHKYVESIAPLSFQLGH